MTSWICPACGRRVPAKVTVCRCGTQPTDLRAAGDAGKHAAKVQVSVGKIGIGVALGLATLIAAVSWTNQRAAPPRREPAAIAAPGAAPSKPAETRAPTATSALAIDPPPGTAPVEVAPEQPVAAVPSSTGLASLEDIVSRSSPAVVTVLTGKVRGSGFFVAPDTILTNIHVVTPDSSVTIRRTDGTTATARVGSTAPAFDIAVLKISNPRPDQPTIPMGTINGARVGQEVIVIGTPLGYLSNSVSRGIISGLRAVSGATMIQTDAAINPGNSGGPLLNRSGEVLGIVNSGYSQRDGLAFAVAIDHAAALLRGDTVAPAQRGPDSAQYTALSPAVPSPGEQSRVDGAKAFDQALARLARAASDLDSQWRSFKRACYEGQIAGSFDREWFALFDRRSMQGAVSPGCGTVFNDLQRAGADIRNEVVAAEEAARRADVYPGVRRDMLRRYRLDYSGWFR